MGDVTVDGWHSGEARPARGPKVQGITPISQAKGQNLPNLSPLLTGTGSFVYLVGDAWPCGFASLFVFRRLKDLGSWESLFDGREKYGKIIGNRR